MTKNEFERLQPGQIIKHKKVNQWAFIVHQNFGDSVTAVRTIEVRDPENWEVITKIQRAEPEMTLRQAADKLHELLKDNPWYLTVGVGDNELFIYTSKKKYPQQLSKYEGFPVTYKYMGKVKPATA